MDHNDLIHDQRVNYCINNHPALLGQRADYLVYLTVYPVCPPLHHLAVLFQILRMIIDSTD